MDFVVLSSSRGTTFQAVLDSINNGTLTARCVGLVSDREDRGCVEKARTAHIPVKIVEKTPGESREAYDKRLDMEIAVLVGAVREPPLLAALGWMYILSPWFVQQWKNRIINVHPALLPKYPGVHAIQEALEAGESETGMTIHLIDEGVDTGPMLLQKTCPVLPDDTQETLKKRIQELEKEWYPRVLEMIQRREMRLP